MNQLAHAFFNDLRVQVALLILVLDLGLGTLAAVVSGNFRLSYIADTLRSDVLGKMFPFFFLYAGYKYASGADIVIPGLDLEALVDGAWVIVLAAIVGSILNSLKTLGLFKGLSDAIAGPEPKPKP